MRRLLGCLLLLAVSATSTHATVTYVAAKEDTQIHNYQNELCANYGSVDSVIVGRAGTKPTASHRALLHFDLSFISRLSQITKAELQLYIESYTASVSAFPIAVSRLTNTSWTEDTATWTSYQCGPAAHSSGEWCQVGADTTSTAEVLWEANAENVAFQRIDVTTLVRHAVGTTGLPGSAPLHTGGQVHLRLRATDDHTASAQHYIRFRTRDHVLTYWPLLVVDWTAGAAPDGNEWMTFRDESATRLDRNGIVPSNDTEEKDVAAADLDDDGDLDIVAVRKNPGLDAGARESFVFLNQNGKMIASAELPASDSRDVFLGDLDGDPAKRHDMVIATTCLDTPKFYRNHGGRCSNWLGLGDAMGIENPAINWQPSAYPGTIRFCAVAGGDVDGDGSTDLYFNNYWSTDLGENCEGAISNQDALLINRINGPEGRFVDETYDRIFGNLQTVAFGTATEMHDLDPTDSVDALDIVKTSTRNAVIPWPERGIFSLPNDGNGYFGPNFDVIDQATGSFAAPYMFSGGFLNSDPYPDFYVASDLLDRVLLSTGPGTYTKTEIQHQRTASFGGNTRLADLDGDHDLDVGVATFDIEFLGCNEGIDQFAILRNDGAGGLSDPYPYNFPATVAIHQGAHDHEFIDVNGDGCLDIFLAGCNSYKVFINTTAPCQAAPPA